MINNKIWIVGFGGVGEALYNYLSLENKVTIFSSKKNIIDNKNHYLGFKYSDKEFEEIIDNIKDEELPDIVIITCGKLYDQENQPEKTITKFNESWLYKSTNYNVLPTAYFAKNITKKLSKNKKIILISFSARVGSISDNGLGGWHSYRMTKAMLNMLIKNIAKEWSIKSPESIAISYHPGTVDTELSRPFHGAIDKSKVFDVAMASKYLVDLIENLDKSSSGKFYDYAGNEIAP